MESDFPSCCNWDLPACRLLSFRPYLFTCLPFPTTLLSAKGEQEPRTCSPVSWKQRQLQALTCLFDAVQWCGACEPQNRIVTGWLIGVDRVCGLQAGPTKGDKNRRVHFLICSFSTPHHLIPPPNLHSPSSQASKSSAPSTRFLVLSLPVSNPQTSHQASQIQTCAVSSPT